MSQRERNILVYADWQELGNPTLMGMLSATQMRGKEIFAFEYDKESLQSSYIHANFNKFLQLKSDIGNETQILALQLK